MCPLLKRSSPRPASSDAVAFELDDVRRRAADLLAAAQRDAASIIAQAQAEIDALRVREASVEAILETRVAERLTPLQSCLQSALGELEKARQATIVDWQRSLVSLSTAIAARVIRRELKTRPEIALDLVREALELAVGSPHIRLLVHPDDRQFLGPQIERLVREVGGLDSVEVVAEARIARGGCRVETQFGSIDQQIETQLARIEDELL